MNAQQCSVAESYLKAHKGGISAKAYVKTSYSRRHKNKHAFFMTYTHLNQFNDSDLT